MYEVFDVYLFTFTILHSNTEVKTELSDLMNFKLPILGTSSDV